MLKSIGTKLTLSVIVSVTVSLIFMIIIISYKVSQNIEKEAENALNIASKRYVNYMQATLNEPFLLSKILGFSIQKIIDDNGNIDINILEDLTKKTLDSSMHTTYAFLYIKDLSILSGNKEKYTQNGNLSIIYNDSTPGIVGGIKTLTQNKNIYNNAPVISKIENNVHNGQQKVIFGSVKHLDYGNGKFLGINLGIPIFNQKGSFAGIVGFSLELSQMAKTLLDPSLNFHEGDLRLLLTDDGTFIVHSDPNAILQKINDYNHSPSVIPVLNAIKEHKNILVDNFFTLEGLTSYASVASFSTLEDSSYWSILVTTPRTSVLAPLYQLEFIIIIVTVIFLIIISAVVYMSIKYMISAKINS
ncbi:cache domain-containing protein, partial [Campylobacter jejuni]|nr:cache domain-containing protein [Campylobacter jejuni]MBC5861736.1 cache domain-containing protein [Campylobacter jejuni]